MSPEKRMMNSCYVQTNPDGCTNDSSQALLAQAEKRHRWHRANEAVGELRSRQWWAEAHHRDILELGLKVPLPTGEKRELRIILATKEPGRNQT